MKSVLRETAEAASVVLEDPSGAAVDFRAGQFFTVLAPLDGETVRRPYTASSRPGEHGGGVRLTIKRVSGGRVSGRLVDAVRAGDEWTVIGPSGSFAPPPATGPRHLVLIAGGSGITPMMAIARTLLPDEPQTRLSLLYGSRGPADILLRAEWEALQSAWPDRLALRLALDEPPPGWAGAVGRLSRALLEEELARLGSADGYYLCGPTPMMEAATEALRTMGVAPERIHTEAPIRPDLRHDPVRPTAPQAVTIRMGAQDRRVTQAPGQTLLDAAAEGGVTMPFSCTVGACGTCKVRVVRGEISMQEPNCLSAEDAAAGLALVCIGNAVVETVVEVL